MYPYHLGCHLKTGRLCRIPHPDLGVGIPVGFARIIKYKDKNMKHLRRILYVTDDGPIKGELLMEYWSIPRWSDIQRELGEEKTGPIMFQVLNSLDGG